MSELPKQDNSALAEARLALQAESQRRNRLFAALFNRGDGAEVLKILEQETLGVPAMRDADADRLTGPADESLYAAWREGQNHVVRMIRIKMRLGEEGR